MKTKLLLLFTCLFYVSIYGQHVVFDNHMITDNANEVWAVFPDDINGDGDIDVVSASAGDNTISWWENDGAGNFTEHEITTSAIGVSSLFVANIDLDADMDVISGSFGDDTIAFWENDGSGNFTEHEITTTADGVSSVFAADIDDDGDMDVISSSFFDNTVAWYENVNGDGTAWVEHVITTNAIGARRVCAAYLDGVGGIDVVSASKNDGIIAWYANDGLGNFGSEQIIIDDPNDAWTVTTGDINGDTFVDVIAAVGPAIGCPIAWWENDGLGDFTYHEVFYPSTTEWLYAYDIDDDGDEDVISAEFSANKLVYFENTDGQGGNFEPQWLQTELGWQQPRSVHVANIDGDGLMDLISGWWGSDHIGWHGNLGLGVDENTLSDFSVYANPTTGILNIQSDIPISQIEIYNLLGQLVKSNTNQNTIDISSVDQGIYFIKVIDENGNIGSQKVVKK